MFVCVKSIKGCFQRGSFNKHVNLSLLKDFFPFQSLKNILLLDQRKKRNTVCKNAPIIALDGLWPHFKAGIWTLSYKKHFLNVFQTYNYKHTKSGSKWNMFTYKRWSCFTVVHILSFLHSMTFDLIYGLHMQIQTWHPPLRLCIHAKYYVKSGLTNVLKNANKTKNMHLFSILIANYYMPHKKFYGSSWDHSFRTYQVANLEHRPENICFIKLSCSTEIISMNSLHVIDFKMPIFFPKFIARTNYIVCCSKQENLFNCWHWWTYRISCSNISNFMLESAENDKW